MFFITYMHKIVFLNLDFLNYKNTLKKPINTIIL
jgi:hypothetical protein